MRDEEREWEDRVAGSLLHLCRLHNKNNTKTSFFPYFGEMIYAMIKNFVSGDGASTCIDL